MTSIEKKYEEYLEIYEEYQKKSEKINRAHSEVVQLSKDLKEIEKNIEVKEEEKVRAEAASKRAEKEIDDYKPVYDKEIQKKSIVPELEKFKQSLIYYKGELADEKRYTQEEERIKLTYKDKEETFCSKRKQELEDDKQKVIKERDKFKGSKNTYIEEIKKDICSGMPVRCDTILEDKRREIKDYLSCNKKIKKSPQANNILNIIEHEKVNPKNCGISEKSLLEKVMALKGTDSYPRSDEVTGDKIDENRSNYQGTMAPALIITGLLSLLFFTFVFTPARFITPSGVAIAGMGTGILQFLIRIVCSILAGAVLGGIIAGILSLFGLAIVGVIVGILVAIYTIWYVYSGHYPVISVNGLMGVGNAIHYIIFWAIQVVLCLLVVLIVYLIIRNTSLVKLFYKPINDIVVEGLNQFADYFNNNKELYLVLFNMDEALGYAYENRLNLKIEKIEEAIANIKKEEDFLQLQDRCERELKQLSQKRNEQKEQEMQRKKKNISLIDGKEEELNDREEKRVRSVKERMRRLKENYAEQIKKIGSCKAALNSLNAQKGKIEKQYNDRKKEEDEIIVSTENQKNYLESVTKEIALNRNDLQRNFRKLNTLNALAECSGNLSSNIYFVKNSLDEKNMAIVRKIPLSCKPTVFIYNKNELTGNNLSEELCHFVEWFCMSIKRTNPPILLNRIMLVDVVSGQSVLQFAPYNEYLSIASSEAEKNQLSTILMSDEKEIIEECNRITEENAKEDSTYTQIVNDMATLNSEKMRINKKVHCEEWEEITIDELWERPRAYNIVIFIVPGVVTNGMQPSALNDTLKQAVKNSERFGVLPIFVIDSEAWGNCKESQDSAFLHELQDRSEWQIMNVGKDKGQTLDLNAQV